MPGLPPPAGHFVYQLRVVLRGVSPLIWRRLVRSDSSIADLHTTLQLALGWSDEHLNRFVVHGREYGVAHPGGIWFRDDPYEVHLADLGLRVGERFLYEYDFIDRWCHDVRVEAILPVEPARRYPVCTGGRRSVRQRDAAGRGPSWSCVSTTRRCGSSSCWRSSSRPTPMNASGRSSAIAMRSSKSCAKG